MATFEEAKKAFNKGKSAHIVAKVIRRREPFIWWLVWFPVYWLYFYVSDGKATYVLGQNEKILDSDEVLENEYFYLSKDEYNCFQISANCPGDWKKRTDWVIE